MEEDKQVQEASDKAVQDVHDKAQEYVMSDLEKMLHDYGANNYRYPKFIQVSPKEFHHHASDDRNVRYLDLVMDHKGHLIGHTFKGIPMVILRSAEGTTFISEEEYYANRY